MSRHLPRAADKRKEQTQTLRELRKLAKQVHTEDAEILRRLEQCPHTQRLCAILADALAASATQSRAEHLTPIASWVHPFI